MLYSSFFCKYFFFHTSHVHTSKSCTKYSLHLEQSTSRHTNINSSSWFTEESTGRGNVCACICAGYTCASVRVRAYAQNVRDRGQRWVHVCMYNEYLEGCSWSILSKKMSANTLLGHKFNVLHFLLSVPAVLVFFFCTFYNCSLWCSALATRFESWF